MIWPSTIIGLIRTPQSSTATTRSTSQTPVSGSTSTGRDVAGERPGEVGRVVVRVVLEPWLHAVGHVAVRRHRALLDRHATVGRAAHVEAAELPLDVFLGHLEKVGGELARLRSDLARHHRDGRTRDGRRPRRIGAHAERRGVGVAFLDHDVLGRDAELVRHDLRPRRLVALALRLRSRAEERLAGHVDPELGRVEHLDAEDVVLAAVARSERLGHRRDADAEQPSARLRLFLLLQEVLVADCFEADVEALAVLARVGEEPERRAVWEVVVTHEVRPAELGLVHAEVVGRGLHHPFLEEHRLGHAERAPVRDAARAPCSCRCPVR